MDGVRHPNLHLRDFLQGEQPVSTEHLWGRLCIARRWNPWAELPATRDEIEHALAVLGALGFAFKGTDDGWRLRYPQPAVKEPGTLFA